MKLNDKQKEAVEFVKGNLLIIASAGTGKTTTIVNRYVNMVENHGILPSQVMMTTFILMMVLSSFCAGIMPILDLTSVMS